MLLDRIPIRYRLSLGHALWMSLLFVGVSLGLYKIVEKNLYDSVDAALVSSARAIRDTRFSMDESLIEEQLLRQYFYDALSLDPFKPQRHISAYAQIISTSGKIHSKSADFRVVLPVTPEAVSRAEKGEPSFETFRVKEDRPPMRQVTLPVMSSRGQFTGDLIQVGASLMHTQDTLNGVAWVLVFFLPLVMAIAVVLGYVLTARSLKPVQQITRAAGKMGIDDLSIRLPLPVANDEMRELSKTFNAMLDRLEDAVKRLRRFTGDVSHELRTPLAVLRGEAELALRRERSSEEYCRSLRTIAKESTHMTSIVEDLLLLARAESKSVAMSWCKLTAEQFVEGVIDQVQIPFAEKAVELVIDTNLQDSFECSESYLALAIKNILLNAAKHSRERLQGRVDPQPRRSLRGVYRFRPRGRYSSGSCAFCVRPVFPRRHRSQPRPWRSRHRLKPRISDGEATRRRNLRIIHRGGRDELRHPYSPHARSLKLRPCRTPCRHV